MDALHANSSQCNMMEDHRTRQETGLCGGVIGREGGRFDVRLLQLLLGRAYGLSLTQGRHAAAKPWGRGLPVQELRDEVLYQCLCVCVCWLCL